MSTPPGEGGEGASSFFERRPFPEDLSLAGLFYPNPRYPYFQPGPRLGLDAGAPAFSPVNAWWLAEAVMLAYLDGAPAASAPGVLEGRLRRAGLEAVGFFHRGDDRASTQGFLAHNDDTAVLVFRGTEPHSLPRFLKDLRTDLDVALVPWPGGGAVHQGFRHALDLVWDLVGDRLRALAATPRRTLWFAGHSLGGALALLAVARFLAENPAVAPARCRVYTFGAPRVGDARFARRFPVRCHRVVNGCYLVTRVPPPWLVGYTHVGTRHFLTRTGNCLEDPPRPILRRERRAGRRAYGPLVRRGWRRGALDTVPARDLADHAPILYVTHLWNHLASRLSHG